MRECFVSVVFSPRREGTCSDGAKSRRRLTLAWLAWAQKEARQTMELLRALPDGVEHELFLAALD